MTHLGHGEKLFVMRIFIALLVLIFSLQSWTKADDIRDFQIEGISIGDSALDFYSKKDMTKYYKDWYEPKYSVAAIEEQRGIYDEIHLVYERNDTKYKIVAISALKYSDMKFCNIKLDDVSDEIKNIFGEDVKKSKKKTSKHWQDKSGKSKVTDIFFKLKKDKDEIVVACYDWSEKMKYWDNLRISIRSASYTKYLNNL